MITLSSYNNAHDAEAVKWVFYLSDCSRIGSREPEPNCCQGGIPPDTPTETMALYLTEWQDRFCFPYFLRSCDCPRLSALTVKLCFLVYTCYVHYHISRFPCLYSILLMDKKNKGLSHGFHVTNRKQIYNEITILCMGRTF